MNTFKKLFPTIMMLLISFTALATSSYAWFSMNTTVTATGMEIKAQAEDGLLISNAEDGTYSNSAEAVNASATLNPATTADFETWYTAKSKKADDGMDLTAAGYIEIDGTTLVPSKYYLANSFWIKSSTESGELDVQIGNIGVTGVNTSAKLDACTRIAFVIGTDIFVYAPISNDDSDNAAGHEATWTVITDATTLSAITSKITATPTEVKVYAYFEGEDKSCRSENITATLDTVKLTFDISIVTD